MSQHLPPPRSKSSSPLAWQQQSPHWSLFHSCRCHRPSLTSRLFSTRQAVWLVHFKCNSACKLPCHLVKVKEPKIIFQVPHHPKQLWLSELPRQAPVSSPLGLALHSASDAFPPHRLLRLAQTSPARQGLPLLPQTRKSLSVPSLPFLILLFWVLCLFIIVLLLEYKLCDMEGS